MKIKVFNSSNNPLPIQETDGSAGVDLRANIAEPVSILPLERACIKTGLHIELPEGYEAQVRPRSGLAFKHGITVLNTPGCIDSDYRGDIGVILINLGTEPFTINPGDRIAQMTFANYERVKWEEVEDASQLSSTARGDGGIGHSGIK